MTHKNKYKDIQGHWAEDEIQYVTEAGLMQGVGDGVFAPDRPATRAELAVVLARMNGYTAPAKK